MAASTEATTELTEHAPQALISGTRAHSDDRGSVFRKLFKQAYPRTTQQSSVTDATSSLRNVLEKPSANRIPDAPSADAVPDKLLAALMTNLAEAEILNSKDESFSFLHEGLRLSPFVYAQIYGDPRFISIYGKRLNLSEGEEAQRILLHARGQDFVRIHYSGVSNGILFPFTELASLHAQAAEARQRFLLGGLPVQDIYQPSGQSADASRSRTAREILEQVKISAWKNQQKREQLDSILDGFSQRTAPMRQTAITRPALAFRGTGSMPLWYFDLFLHAHEREAKDCIARHAAAALYDAAIDTMFAVTQETSPFGMHKMKIIRIVEPQILHSLFAFAIMYVHHLKSSTDTRKEHLSHSTGLRTAEGLYVDRSLSMISGIFDYCIGAVTFNHRYAIGPFAKQPKAVRQLMLCLALESITMKAELSSTASVAALSEGLAADAKEDAVNWATYVRHSLEESLQDSEQASNEDEREQQQVLRLLDRHRRDEDRRTKEVEPSVA